MVDIFLVVSIFIAVGILIVSGIYLIVYYQHPDDHNDAYGPKFVVLMGYILAGGTVLLLPLDVANNEGYAGCAGYDTALCGGIPMKWLWNIIFYIVPLWIFVFIPFCTFYYEADDGQLMAGTSYSPNPAVRSKFGQAACYQAFVLIVVGIFFVVTFVSLSETSIPIKHYEADMPLGNLKTNNNNNNDDDVVVHTYPAKTNNDGEYLLFHTSNLIDLGSYDFQQMSRVTQDVSEDHDIVLQVDVGTFFAGVMAWIGWFLLALFGGIGLAALPLDLLLTYIHRPKHMDAKEFAEVQINLRERVNELVDIGELIKIEREEKKQAGLISNGNFVSSFTFDSEKRKAARDEKQAILGFKQAVYLLEQDTEDFKAHTEQREQYNPLTPYIALVLGICSVIISFFWFLHIIIYVFPKKPIMPFLNTFFRWFDSWFPLLGVLSVAIFTSYLMLCAIKGCFKFGIRFLFFTIHPMKPSKTYMSSFMFNIGLVLLCSMPIVQFCQDSFQEYTAYSEIRQLFGVQIQYLKFFRYFWLNNVFVYAFFTFTVLSTLYLTIKPHDHAASGQALRDRLRSRKL